MPERSIRWHTIGCASATADTSGSIETHIDNGIPHAHIVVNSVNPVDGRKIHLDDNDVQADAMELQRICRD